MRKVDFKFKSMLSRECSAHAQLVRHYPEWVVERPAGIPFSAERNGSYELYEREHKRWNTYLCLGGVWVVRLHAHRAYFEGHGTEDYYDRVDHPGEATLAAIRSLPHKLLSKEAINLERYWRLKKLYRDSYMNGVKERRKAIGR
jgi:hypothetical protein